MAERQFRTDQSYVEERVTRDMVPGFLESRGFSSVTDARKGQAQTILAKLPSGDAITMRVRLCWNRSGKKNRSTYSAFQLIARVEGNDWDESIKRKVARDKQGGVTHILAVQREDSELVLAALIPIGEVLPIWHQQRAVGEAQISSGRLTANPVLNGSSPTIYLQLERAPAIASALWQHQGVIDVVALPRMGDMSSAGAGYGDSQQNRLTEVAAVGLVRVEYERAGWTVRSREQDGCGYDLHCTRGGEEAHVEVKGVRGTGRSFNITAGEVRCANEDPSFVLVLVNAVLTKAPVISRFSGADLRHEFSINPIQYRAIAKTDMATQGA
jgi:hypothetical protein